jgi:FAD/FMN-containing dehydrogenase
MILAGWGNYPRIACRTAEIRSRDALPAIFGRGPLIARGNGRAYGDAALQPNLTVLCRRMDRLLAFEPETGSLTCEAGLRLETLLDLFVPRGWFPPVTPGTKFVTLGGMVAADVHGKNHHGGGSFGRYVDELGLMLPDGRILACSRHENADLFAATIGGMGLTGIILTVRFRMKRIESARMRVQTIRAPSLDAALEGFEASADWTYNVSWIDCLSGGARLGRSLLSRGEHALAEELPAELRGQPFQRTPSKPKRVPVDFPQWALNRFSVRAFNEFYYRASPRQPDSRLVAFDPFFYPLDALLEWNRIYGKSGFTQYQCVLPKQAGREGLTALLKAIQRGGGGSFLAVLKLFGAQESLLSFPMEGYTLALDFPVTAPNLNLLNELDAIVADHGGRLYLAKDARTTPAMIRRGYPRLGRFQEIRARYGAIGLMQSLQAERLNL